jgi:cyclohexyl-isocyanide hydratase
MDMVGVQTVFGLMPGARIYLVWKSLEPVEGFPAWWTIPSATFSDCPDLDVIAVPMLPPEIQNDREVINFVEARGRKARYVIGICNGVLMLGAAGLLKGKRATTSYNSLPILPHLGVAEVVSGGGVVADGNLYTAGPVQQCLAKSRKTSNGGGLAVSKRLCSWWNRNSDDRLAN